MYSFIYLDWKFLSKCILVINKNIVKILKPFLKFPVFVDTAHSKKS